MQGVSRVITVSVPGPELIIFEATGYFVFTNNAWCTARASLSLADTVDNNNMVLVSGRSTGLSSSPYEITRALTAQSAGAYSAFLIGDMGTGTGASLTSNNVSALFFPY